jgi:hypothetical protein
VYYARRAVDSPASPEDPSRPEEHRAMPPSLRSNDSGAFDPATDLSSSSREFLAMLGRESLLMGHRVDRVGMPLTQHPNLALVATVNPRALQAGRSARCGLRVGRCDRSRGAAAPSLASASAISRPTPWPAPVINASSPSRLPIRPPPPRSRTLPDRTDPRPAAA